MSKKPILMGYELFFNLDRPMERFAMARFSFERPARFDEDHILGEEAVKENMKSMTRRPSSFICTIPLLMTMTKGRICPQPEGCPESG